MNKGSKLSNREAAEVLKQAAALLESLTPAGRRKARNRRYYQKRKASQSVLNKTKTDGREVHRGLTWEHMPGRRENKRMTFALFKRGEWPPPQWRIPEKLTGGDLMMLLHERAASSNQRRKA